LTEGAKLHHVIMNAIAVGITLFALISSFDILTATMAWSRIFYPSFMEGYYESHWLLSAIWLSSMLVSLIMRFVSIAMFAFIAIALNCFVVLNVLRVIGKGRGYVASYWIVGITVFFFFSGAIATLPFSFLAAATVTVAYSIKHATEYRLVGLSKRRKWIALIFFVPIIGGIIALIKYRRDIKYLLLPGERWRKPRAVNRTQ